MLISLDFPNKNCIGFCTKSELFSKSESIQKFPTKTLGVDELSSTLDDEGYGKYRPRMTLPNRRESLLERMTELESRGMGCNGCSGKCCTFEANSMLITPLETIELLEYLKTSQLMTLELKNKMQTAVEKYRLESKPLLGGRSYLRKTYTCPFFNHQELGCPLPREIKPYGCLAFNSHHIDLKATEHCYSETELLKKRDQSHLDELLINQNLRTKYKLFWEKSPIPSALLDLWDKI